MYMYSYAVIAASPDFNDVTTLGLFAVLLIDLLVVGGGTRIIGVVFLTAT